MYIPFFCIFIAFILNYLTKIPVAMAMAKAPNGYDNHLPREQQALLTGLGKRALGAHLNSFEIFPAFASSVIVAHIAKVDPTTLTILSVVFVISRIMYWICYLLDQSTLRSTIWGIGIVCVTILFFKAIFGLI